MFFCTMTVIAQEQPEQQNSIVDSLTTNLNKLQRDFNFLRCDFELTKKHHDLNDFCNNINTRSNGVLFNCYHGTFSYELYKAYSKNYESSVEALETLKQNITVVKTLVALIMYSSDFTSGERELLTMSCDLFDTELNSATSALNYYKVVIDIYWDKFGI